MNLFNLSFFKQNLQKDSSHTDSHHQMKGIGDIWRDNGPQLTSQETKLKRRADVGAREKIIKKVKNELATQEKKLMSQSILSKRYLENNHLLTLIEEGKIDPFKALVMTSMSYSAQGTGYEGWNLHSVANLYSTVVESIKEEKALFSQKDVASGEIKTNLKHLQESSQTIGDVDQKAGFIAEAIDRLKAGESYTMEGGWTDVPHGHAMIYRFERQANKTLNIYIYNAQQGSEKTQGGREFQWRKRTFPYTCFANVPQGEFFFCMKGEEKNLSILKNLLLLQEAGKIESKDKMMVIFDSFAHLKGRLIPPDHQSELFISIQRSGNCAVKSTNCLLLDLVKDYGKYKKLSLDMRLNTIISVYHHFKKKDSSKDFENEERDTQLFQLKEAVANFIRILDSNFKKEKVGITEEQYIQAMATMQEIQQDLNKVESDIGQLVGPKVSILAEYDEAREGDIAKERTEFAEQLPSILQTQMIDKTQSFTPLLPNFGKEITWETFSHHLQQLVDRVNALKKENRTQDLIFQIEAAFKNLSHLKESRSLSLGKKKAKQLQEQLIQLQTLYNTQVFLNGDLASPAFQNTGMEFLALSYCLALTIDREKNFNVLKNYGLATDYFFNSARKDRLFAIQDPELLEQRKSLEIFFKKHSARPIWNLTTELINKKEFLARNSVEGQMYQEYIEKIPSIREFFINIAAETLKKNDVIPIQGAWEIVCGKEQCPQLDHIDNLGGAALLACAAQGYYDPDPSKRKPYGNKSLGRDGTFNLCETPNIKWYLDRSYPYLSSYQDFSSDGSLDHYIRNTQSDHQYDQLTKENPLLIKKEEKEIAPNLSFYIALAEPDVQTTTLLQSTENHMERLKDVKFRRMLNHMFMKNVEKNKEIISPFIESLKDVSMLRKFERVISIGKRKFIDSLPETKPNLDEMLFLVRLYARALCTIQALHPDIVYSDKTNEMIKELQELLDKAITLPPLEDEESEIKIKREIRVARLGLMQGLSLKNMQVEELSSFLSSTITFKNEIQALSSSEDPSFVRDCKRRFFNLERQWHEVLGCDNEMCDALGNHLLSSVVGNKNTLKWTFDQTKNELTATDALGEKWVIDLIAPSLRNSKGMLKEVFSELDSTDDFKRLFRNKRHALKVFGGGTPSEKIIFQSPVWGNIQVIGKKNQSQIHREIEGSWYTYIPRNSQFEQGLKLNNALFGDHVLWVNLQNSSDIRFCDLQTGKELYHMKNGRVFHNETGQLFYQIQSSDIKQKTQLSRFENLQEINGWVDEADTILECNRLRSLEGNNPLTFSFDKERNVWVYSENPSFHIDTNLALHLKFQIDRFLPLINKEGTKRKILVPKSAIVSSGYSPLARVVIPPSEGLKEHVALDGQKGSMKYIEYDLDSEGSLIGRGIEENIYLAHLFLGQKKYGAAVHLIKSISSSENLSPNVIKAIELLIASSKPIQDYSPNAAAVHLQLYLMAMRVNPLFQLNTKNALILAADYEKYIYGLNGVEYALQLTSEEELSLIEAFENHPSELTYERKNFLLKRTSFSRIYQFPSKNQSKSIALSLPKTGSLNVSDDEASIKKQSHKFVFNLLFYHDKEIVIQFKKHYKMLKNTKNNSLKFQGLIYDILFDTKYKGLNLSNDQLEVLYYVSLSPENAPSWLKWSNDSMLSDSKYRKAIEWVKQLKSLENEKNLSTNRQSELTYEAPQAQIERKIIQVPSNFLKKKEKIQKEYQGDLNLLEEGQDERYAKWQENYLAASKKEDSVSLKKETPLPLVLRESEQVYAEAIKKHQDHYVNDCQIARNKQRVKLAFKKELKIDDYKRLAWEMKEEGKRCSKNEVALLKKIDLLVAKGQVKTDSTLHYSTTQVIQKGFAKVRPNLETILRAASQDNGEKALLELNRYLLPNEIQELRSIAVEYMIEVTHRRHLERVYPPLFLWINSQKNHKPNHPLFEIAQEAFIEKRSYDPTKKLFPLFFEYLGDIRVREKQANIINNVLKAISQSSNEEMRKKAFQLIMAGGKTSVIISILVELIASSGTLACVMCHHSQLASVKGNLTAFQKNRFDKDLFIIDYSIQDLGKEEVLDVIIRRLNEATRKGVGLVMKTSLSDFIELKFLLESDRLSKIKVKSEKEKQQRLVDKLAKINQMFSSNAVGIYDECDINLSMLTDVNIPQGKMKNIEPEQAALMKRIYRLLIDPQIKNIVRLDENLQTELSNEDLENIVLPFLAGKIFDSFDLNGKWKQPFSRYVTEKISPESQRKADRYLQMTESEQKELIKNEDVAFLLELERMYHSKNIYQKESAQLIALTKKILCKVLRVSLSRSFNRNYGRDPDYNDGRVCPYLAVDTPAITKFGNVYISLAYQFQSALANGISEGEILFLATKMTQVAQYFALKEKKNFLETVEAIQFKELTSVDLIDIQTTQGLKKAFQYVNDPNHLEYRLNLEAEVAPFHVRYHHERLSSNPINNVSRFKEKGSIACSGTLWNQPTYHQDFRNPYLDSGTEGSILNVIAEKNAPIHEIANRNLDHFFSIIHNHKNKKNIRGIVDGGGFFQDYNNDQLVEKVKFFLENEQTNGDPCVKAIVYVKKYSQSEIDQGHPKESFVFNRLDGKTSSPIRLKNTSKEELEKHGLTKDDIFVIFDELRTTGTDIELADEAIFLATFDHNMLMRTALQQTLRARKFFQNQQVEIVVTSKGRKEMVNGGKTFQDIRATVEKNEAIALQEQKNRTRIAQLENIVRFNLLHEILNANQVDREKKRQDYAQFFISKYEDDPYLVSGKIVGKRKTKDVLLEYAARIKKRLQGVHSKHEALIIKEIDKLTSHFATEISDNEYMGALKEEDMDIEILQEEEIEINVAIEEEQKVEINQELINELQTYNYQVNGPAYQEMDWKLNGKQSLWEQIGHHLIQVKKTLERADFQKSPSSNMKSYAHCFPSNLTMTSNFYRTAREDLPLLHPYIKEAKFLLAMENQITEECHFTLVSEKDAAFFKNWLPKNPSSRAYLVDLNGLPEGNSKAFDQAFNKSKESESLKMGLCYANLFNGNIDYLEKHPEIAKAIIPKDPKNMMNFIQLKIISSQGVEGLKNLLHSKLFKFEKLLPIAENGVVFSARRLQMKHRYNAIAQMGEEEIGKLDVKDIPMIAEHQVPWLKKKDQIKHLNDNLINYLTVTQLQQGLLDQSRFHLLNKEHLIRTAIQCDKKLIKKLVKEQEFAIKVTDIEHLTHQQLGWLTRKELIEALIEQHKVTQLTEKQVSFVKKTTDVQALNKEQVNFINQEVVQNLSPKQVSWLTDAERINCLLPGMVQSIAEQERSKLTKPELIFALSNAVGLKKEQLKIVKAFIRNQIESSQEMIEKNLQPWQVIYIPQGKMSEEKRTKLLRKTSQQAVLEKVLVKKNLDLEIIDHLTEEQIRCLDIKDETEARLISKLDDRQFDIYSPPPSSHSRGMSAVKGVVQVLFLPFNLGASFVLNMGLLLIFTSFAIFSKSWRETAKNQFRETFTYSPGRKFACFWRFHGEQAYRKRLSFFP